MNNNADSINILCATDNNYAPYCGIMLTSLFESNKESHFNVYVLLDGHLTESNAKKYKRLEQSYACSIFLVPVDNRLLEKCPVNQHIDVDNHSWVSIPTYYRLLAAELLPATVNKIIYLDCDIVVDGDIRPLWMVDLSGKAVGGIVDCDSCDNSNRMGYSEEDGYFNAGVAVYNLEYWRNNSITEAFLDFINNNGSKLLLMDQDVINGVLYDKIQWLPERFNFQVSYFDPLFWNRFSEMYKSTIISECGQAVVVHYCGGLKPWDYRYYGCPFYTLWNDYRKISFWKASHVTKPTSKYVKFLLKNSFFSKQLKKKRKEAWVVLPENSFCFN